MARALLECAIIYPSETQEKQKQITLAKNILLTNHYPMGFISNVMQKIQNAPTPHHEEPILDIEPWINIPIPYVPSLHKKIQNLLPDKVRLAPRTFNQVHT